LTVAVVTSGKSSSFFRARQLVRTAKAPRFRHLGCVLALTLAAPGQAEALEPLTLVGRDLGIMAVIIIIVQGPV